MRKKGFIYFDLAYFLFALILVLIGFIILFFMIKAESSDDKDVMLSKDAYQTIQIARTYLETPLTFTYDDSKGKAITKTQSVAEWASFYFTCDEGDTNKLRLTKDELKNELINLGNPLKIYLFQRETMAATFFYIEGETTSPPFLVVATPQKVKKEDKGAKQISANNMGNENIELRIPVYDIDLASNPTYSYILFRIGALKFNSGEK